MIAFIPPFFLISIFYDYNLKNQVTEIQFTSVCSLLAVLSVCALQVCAVYSQYSVCAVVQNTQKKILRSLKYVQFTYALSERIPKTSTSFLPRKDNFHSRTSLYWK